MMISLTRKLIVVTASIALGLWLSLIAKNHMPLIFISQIGIVFAFIWLIYTRLHKPKLMALLFYGGAIGFFSAIAASAVSELVFRGFQGFIVRDFTSNLYFYPLFSLSWLHGMIVIVALAGGRR